MTTVLDATPLAMTSGGLRRYVEELSKALAREFPEDRFILAADQRLKWSSPASNLEVDAHRPRRWVDRRWWLFGVQRVLRHAAVFHGTNFSVPYLPLRPSVLTLHDLSPWKDAAWHTNASRTRSRTPILIRTGIATVVITPCASIRAEAIDYFGMAADRVIAVAEAPADHFMPGEPWSGEPYFLFAGTIEPRKRVPWLIECWREVHRTTGIKLVLAGRRRDDAPAVAEEPGLQILGEVDEDVLASLYTGAIASIYPSVYEGFGLPVLEAMACGCPVIAGSAAALRETAGDAALFVSSDRSLVDAMLAVATLADLRLRLRDAGLKRAAQFSWRQTAHATRAVYQEAVRRFGA